MIARLSINPYLKTVLRDLGLLIHIPAAMALLSLPICLLAGEYYAVVPFLLTAIAALITGQGLFRLFRQASASKLRQALITVALSWAVIPVFGALPFLLIADSIVGTPPALPTIAYFQSPWNALFEATSGFTSAGLTMTIREAVLPHSLQWWRSFMQWIGGVGVIVLMIAVLEPATSSENLYFAEGRSRRIGITLQQTVRNIWWIYLLYTLAGILLLRIAGMPWWEALNHSMTAISTGGFSVTNNSMAAYGAREQLAVIVLMILGAISFANHFQFLTRRRLKALWGDAQHRALWLLLALGFGLLLAEVYWYSGRVQGLNAGFQWVSALTTCGFASLDVQQWSLSAKLLLSLGMIFGAASGSTVGGLKLNRVISLYKAVAWRFERTGLRPHQLMRYQLDGRVVSPQEANRQIESAAVLAVLWLSLVAVGTVVLVHIVGSEYTLADVVFEVASALGSAGLSSGITGPMLPWAGKLTLMLLMWMGRLEIIPVLLLLSMPLRHLSKR
ncbi:TrkH family potassium uptake protein [Almyronema epifaneia]|uniref:TrkH family potassium uptake protein n=1 Tax=Almyronema epifaneia S1 TaxID=2991925 RepID=A0ABW6IG13_9CYAN